MGEDKQTLLENSIKYNWLNHNRLNGSVGGGIAIGVTNQMIMTNRTHEIPEAVKANMEIQMIDALHQTLTITVINLYIPPNNIREAKYSLKHL